MRPSIAVAGVFFRGFSLPFPTVFPLQRGVRSDLTEARKGSSYAKHCILLIPLAAGNGFKKIPLPAPALQHQYVTVVTSNFTITESTPFDVEVAVDPEMFGKIFEELVTGWHETGSYYTPKRVVSFLCRAALIRISVSAGALRHYPIGAPMICQTSPQRSLSRFAL